MATRIVRPKRQRTKAATCAILFLAFCLALWLLLRPNQIVGRVWNQRTDSCVGVTLNHDAITLMPRASCNNSNSDWSYPQVGSTGAFMYHTETGAACLTNNGDGTALLSPVCTGELNQQFQRTEESRIVSSLSPNPPIIINNNMMKQTPNADWCLAAWAGYLHGGSPLGFRKCSQRILDNERWIFQDNPGMFTLF